MTAQPPSEKCDCHRVILGFDGISAFTCCRCGTSHALVMKSTSSNSPAPGEPVASNQECDLDDDPIIEALARAAGTYDADAAFKRAARDEIERLQAALTRARELIRRGVTSGYSRHEFNCYLADDANAVTPVAAPDARPTE